MKNIFKFMGIALIATSLMVACDKDNNETTDTTGTQEETIPDGFKVTFDGTEWTPTSSTVTVSEQYGATLFDLYVEGESNLPEVYGLSYQYGVGSTTSTAPSTGNYAGYLAGDENNAFYKFDYYDATYLYSVSSTTGNTTYYGDWWGKEVTFDIKAFDATALTMTATIDATVFDALAVFVDQSVDYDNADTKTVAITMGNVAITAM